MRVRSIRPPHLVCAFSTAFFRPVFRVKDIPHRLIPAKGIACDLEDAVEIIIFGLDELDTHFFLIFLILSFRFFAGNRSSDFCRYSDVIMFDESAKILFTMLLVVFFFFFESCKVKNLEF